jgi:1-aminocyclopropane-1-carboxylate deaminase
MQLRLPSPTQTIQFSTFAKAGLHVAVKRDDLIHPVVSGNKWRKLRYNLLQAGAIGAKGIITFGGAYSNHLAAAAFATKTAGLGMVAIVRGEEALADLNNKTIAFLRTCGVQIEGISRDAYAKKEDPAYLQTLLAKYPNHYIIPEGGANVFGLQGCMEILHEVDQEFDVAAAPLGTATTFSGLLAGGFAAKQMLGFPAVKGGEYLRGDVEKFLDAARIQGLVPNTFHPPEWRLVCNYHFGGFGKVSAELIGFMNQFYRETGVALDPVYTAKMAYGLAELADSGAFAHGTRLLMVHTGGLQGIAGINAQLRNKGLIIEYEEAVGTPDFTALNPW